MNLYYWRPDAARVNLGDYLTVPLMESLGIRVDPYVPGSPVVFGVGSILHPNHYVRDPIRVWGSGIGSAEGVPEGTRFLAVRGPLTRDVLGLDHTIPLGDPALLYPWQIRLPGAFASGVVYVNHCSQDPPVCPEGADVGLGTLIAPEKTLVTVAQIAAASFVASESLHGCILAAAYGIPWGPCSPRWVDEVPLQSKWTDWMCYLGLTPLVHFPSTIREAKAWWERIGRHGRIQDLKPLLDSCPRESRITHDLPTLPCIYEGDRVNIRGSVKQWRTCTHPETPLGNPVCPCKGCGPKCPSYKEDEE